MKKREEENAYTSISGWWKNRVMERKRCHVMCPCTKVAGHYSRTVAVFSKPDRQVLPANPLGRPPKKTEKTSQLICIWTCGQAAIVSGQTAPTFQHSCYNNSTGPRRTRLVNGTTGLLVDKIKTTFQDDIILTITRHTHTYLISSLT